jgi:hypothetical protein
MRVGRRRLQKRARDEVWQNGEEGERSTTGGKMKRDRKEIGKGMGGRGEQKENGRECGRKHFFFPPRLG